MFVFALSKRPNYRAGVVALTKQFAPVELVDEDKSRPKKVDASTFFDMLIYASSAAQGYGKKSSRPSSRSLRQLRGHHPSSPVDRPHLKSAKA